MGAEATCGITFKRKTFEGKVRLETSVLQVRAEGVKLDLPFKSVNKVSAQDGVLTLTHPGGTLTLALGRTAQKWAEKILHPPSRLSKIGARADWRASVLGDIDREFLSELKAAVATVSVGRAAANSDAIFLAVTRTADLRRLERLKRSLKPNGALWIVRLKGGAEITEREAMAAGKAAGLVDVKVVGFSPTHTAEKFVVRLKDRPKS